MAMVNKSIIFIIINDLSIHAKSRTCAIPVDLYLKMIRIKWSPGVVVHPGTLIHNHGS